MLFYTIIYGHVICITFMTCKYKYCRRHLIDVKYYLSATLPFGIHVSHVLVARVIVLVISPLLVLQTFLNVPVGTSLS